MAVEIERLVVEEGQQAPARALTFEFQRGLTVAFHENPAVRARFIADLLEALGPGRSGLHAELVDGQHRRLAVFRPFGERHRVVDIDRVVDVSDEHRAPGDRVDVLGRLGLDLASAHRTMRIGPQELEGGPAADADNPRLVRVLGAADQTALWAAADTVDATNVRLATAIAGVGGATVEQVAAFDALAAARHETDLAIAENVRVMRLGFSVAAACAIVGGVLLALDGLLDDRQFTGRALLALSVVAMVLSVLDRRHVNRARHAEATVLREAGIEDYDAYLAAAGPLGSDEARREVHDATQAVADALQAWRAVAGDATVAWARENRAIIDRVAERHHRLAELDSSGLLGERDTAAAARLLIDKAIELREVGLTRERLPLLLDEPFAGMPLVEIGRLLETVLRLAQGPQDQAQQILLVTGDPYIQAWAGEAAGRGVAMTRIGRPGAQPRAEGSVAADAASVATAG